MLRNFYLKVHNYVKLELLHPARLASLTGGEIIIALLYYFNLQSTLIVAMYNWKYNKRNELYKVESFQTTFAV